MVKTYDRADDDGRPVLDGGAVMMPDDDLTVNQAIVLARSLGARDSINDRPETVRLLAAWVLRAAPVVRAAEAQADAIDVPSGVAWLDATFVTEAAVRAYRDGQPAGAPADDATAQRIARERQAVAS